MSTEQSPTPDPDDREVSRPATHPDERSPEGDTERTDVVEAATDAEEPDKWDGWVGEGEPPPLGEGRS